MINDPIYVIDGARSPFLKAQSKIGPGSFSASELAVQVGKSLLLRQTFGATEIDEVILGCTTPSAREMNIARIVSLRLGCGDLVPAWTVMRNCASGLQAIDSASQSILLGKSDLILCGGTDALSNAPFTFSKEATRWFTQISTTKTFTQKIKKIKQFSPSFLKPVVSILEGLTDPVVGINMGQTAENLAKKFSLERTKIDHYSMQSHQRATKFKEEIHTPQVHSIFDEKGKFYANDDGVRPDIKIEKLEKLRAVFDYPDGKITAGNSSQISDGSSILILASEKAIKKYNLEPIAIIKDIQWAGLNPSEMGLGPIHAMSSIINRNKIKKTNIDAWEINEAFAAQVLGCQSALNSSEYCSKKLNLQNTFGEIDESRLNIAGGAIALGHPVGASGARIVLNLIHILKKNSWKNGIASICIGGGQGGAALVELC
jgi:acetyl-CoA C-acetyltransferase